MQPWWQRTRLCAALRMKTWSGAWLSGGAGAPGNLMFSTTPTRSWAGWRLACGREGNSYGMTVVQSGRPPGPQPERSARSPQPPEDPGDGLGSPVNHLLLEILRSYRPVGVWGISVLQGRVSCLPPFSCCLLRDDCWEKLPLPPPSTSKGRGGDPTLRWVTQRQGRGLGLCRAGLPIFLPASGMELH